MFSVARFNTQLADMGQAVTWARASRCPCQNQEDGSGSPDPDCPLCNGDGVLWAAPVKGRTGISGMKVQREWAREGGWRSGDVVVSIPSDTPFYAAGEFDRVVMLQSSQAFDRVFTRGARNERFPWHPVCADRCFWLTPDGTAVLEGSLPALAKDAAPEWEEGATAPPDGTRYTLQGRYRPEYFLFRDLAQDRAHYGGQALPRRAVLRLFALFGEANGGGQ